jgi:hypothetical protein
VASQHVAQDRTGGTELHVAVHSGLDESMQLIRRYGPHRCQPADGCLNQFATHLVDTGTEGRIGKMAAGGTFAALGLAGSNGYRCSSSQGKEQSFVAVQLSAFRHCS